MLRAPVPDRAYPDIYAITPAMIRGRGIRLLLLDLDNTLLPYEIDEPTPQLREWIARMRAAGAEPFIFSNNRGGRPAVVAEKLGIGFIGRAKKPNPRKLLSLLREKGVEAGETALIGASVHNVEEALAAQEDGADYVGVGAIFKTSTKADAVQGLGLDAVFQVKEAVKIPVVAIGGINRGNIQDVIRAGADSAAVVSAVVSAEDVSAAAHELRDLILKIRPHVRREDLGEFYRNKLYIR